mmetsp:Transcript_5697/g.16044  ORF Transcript_5697/g.16044 Transcript_5697/m.16044 type:complete len:260 (-) Transcript_5697:279-1058(-)
MELNRIDMGVGGQCQTLFRSRVEKGMPFVVRISVGREIARHLQVWGHGSRSGRGNAHVGRGQIALLQRHEAREQWLRFVRQVHELFGRQDGKSAGAAGDAFQTQQPRFVQHAGDGPTFHRGIAQQGIRGQRPRRSRSQKESIFRPRFHRDKVENEVGRRVRERHHHPGQGDSPHQPAGRPWGTLTQRGNATGQSFSQSGGRTQQGIDRHGFALLDRIPNHVRIHHGEETVKDTGHGQGHQVGQDVEHVGWDIVDNGHGS